MMLQGVADKTKNPIKAAPFINLHHFVAKVLRHQPNTKKLLKLTKMKLFCIVIGIFALAAAAPRTEDAVVLKSDSEVGPESFQYA